VCVFKRSPARRLSSTVLDLYSLVFTCHKPVETDEEIELVFGTNPSSNLSCDVLQGNSCIHKNKITYLWNFISYYGLRKFRPTRMSIAATYCQLSSREVDTYRDKLTTVVGRTKLTMPATVDGYFITTCLQHNDGRSTGSSATADTCKLKL